MKRAWHGMLCTVTAFLTGVLLFSVGDAFAAGQAEYAVVTANPYATEVGMRVLASGGSAADAAVAIQMVLGVVEPQASGLGGGAIALYRDARDRRIAAFDGLAKSPASYDAASSALPAFSHSGAAVGVPGSLRMLELLHRRYGKLPWNTLFQGAIELADKGFAVSPYLARSLASASKAGMAVPSWLTDRAGKAVAEGTIVRNAELAETLRKIAVGGAAALYVESAKTIVEAVQRAALPGRLTPDDMSNYQVVERVPLCLRLSQHDICTFPPPSYGGIAVLELLDLLANRWTSPPSFVDAAFVHRFIEAGRLAEVDRAALVGDPDFGPVAGRELLDPAYIAARAALIRDDSAVSGRVSAGDPPGISRPACVRSEHAPAPSTSQISIVDASENALAMTTTINVNFGAWITAGGFFLNDAMTNFALPKDGGCPANAPAGSKRAETAMAPVMATDATGAVVLIGGSAGGGEIVDYVAQAVLELLAGRPPAEALDDGHVSTAKSPYADSEGVVQLEQGRAVAQLANTLRALGHKVQVVPLQSGMAFIVREQGHWNGAADPRRDGIFASSR